MPAIPQSSPSPHKPLELQRRNGCGERAGVRGYHVPLTPTLSPAMAFFLSFTSIAGAREKDLARRSGICLARTTQRRAIAG